MGSGKKLRESEILQFYGINRESFGLAEFNDIGAKMEYVEAEQVVIDEIFPNSDLRFYDPRRTENNTLFWVKPSGKIHPSYIIYQELSSPEFPGEKVLSPIKEFRDQIDCIGHIARFLARNSLGIEAKMQIL